MWQQTAIGCRRDGDPITVGHHAGIDYSVPVRGNGPAVAVIGGWQPSIRVPAETAIRFDPSTAE